MTDIQLVVILENYYFYLIDYIFKIIVCLHLKQKRLKTSILQKVNTVTNG